MAIPASSSPVHWGCSFPFFQYSSNEFYELVKSIVSAHEFPGIKIERIEHKEKGLFSSKREYLRIRFEMLIYDICAMPFGKDFCVSSWFYEAESATSQILKHTKVGEFLSKKSKERTFYEADEIGMFKSCVHSALVEVTDKMIEGKGVRGVPDALRLLKETEA
jgi:hypothetical protein